MAKRKTNLSDTPNVPERGYTLRCENCKRQIDPNVQGYAGGKCSDCWAPSERVQYSKLVRKYQSTSEIKDEDWPA